MVSFRTLLLLAAGVDHAFALPGFFTLPNIATITFPSFNTPNGGPRAETAKTENSITFLDIPTFPTAINGPTTADTTPVYTAVAATPTGTRAHPSPQTAIEEKSALQLNTPTAPGNGAAQTPAPQGNNNNSNSNSNSNSSSNNSGSNNNGGNNGNGNSNGSSNNSNNGNTNSNSNSNSNNNSNNNAGVYVPQSGAATTAGLIIAGAPAAAQVQAPTSAITVYTSAGVVYSTTVPVTPPAILHVSQSGAVGLAAGPALTVAGTTYSVAPGGSVIYVNGVSSTVSGSVWLYTNTASWTTSGSVVLSNGTPVTAGQTSSSSKTSATAAPAATPGTNAGISIFPSMWATIITLGLISLVFI